MFTSSLLVITIVIGLILMAGYFYVAGWLMPKRKDQAQPLSWLAMFLATLSILVLFIAWMIHDPLAEDLFPAFLVISIVVGLVFRESAISPNKLAKFWSGFHNKNRK